MILNKDKESRDSVVRVLTLLSIFTAGGTIGYKLIESWPWLDSFYMAVITLSTVGFTEVQPLSPSGRIFTSVYIMLGMCVVAYSFSVLGQMIIEGKLRDMQGRSKMKKNISRLRGHIIICGYSELGKLLIEELKDKNINLVVIDIDPTRFEQIREDGLLAVLGNAHDDQILKEAGIDHASRLICLLPSDAENVYTALSAKELNPELSIISRANGTNKTKLTRAGVDRVFSPYEVSAQKLAEQISRSSLSDYLEIRKPHCDSQLILEELLVQEDCGANGRTIDELFSRAEIESKNICLAAIIDNQGDLFLNPPTSHTLKSDDVLVILGDKEILNSLSVQFEVQQLNS